MANRHCYRVRGTELALLTVPKVAATSMQSVLDIDPEPILAHEAQRKGYFVATFVRHPLDRLVSSWANKSAEISPGMEAAGFRVGWEFGQWVHHARIACDLDHHTRPQVAFVMHRGRLAVDFIGRFERLEADWSRLARMFNLPDLPKENASDRGPWREHYNAQTERIAREIYARDLRLLGYA